MKKIEAVLSAARTNVNETGGKIHAIMQPHRYTRLRDLFDDFSTCFNDVDTVYIADVYEAGETPIDTINGQALAQAVHDHGHKNASYIPDITQLPDLLSNHIQPNDMVVFFRCGRYHQMGL